MLWASDFDDGDWVDIHYSIRNAAAKAKASGVKDWFQFINPEHVYDAIVSHEVEACLVGGYLIVFSVGPSWYNRDVPFVEEHLVLRVYPGAGDFRVVPAALEHIARSIPNCGGICVGTALTREDRLFRVYQRLGFKPEAQSLFRRI